MYDRSGYQCRSGFRITPRNSRYRIGRRIVRTWPWSRMRPAYLRGTYSVSAFADQLMFLYQSRRRTLLSEIMTNLWWRWNPRYTLIECCTCRCPSGRRTGIDRNRVDVILILFWYMPILIVQVSTSTGLSPDLSADLSIDTVNDRTADVVVRTLCCVQVLSLWRWLVKSSSGSGRPQLNEIKISLQKNE